MAVSSLVERIGLVGIFAGVAAADVHPALVGFDYDREHADPITGLGVAVGMTADGMGFFGYNPNYKAYIEVISFNQLVKAAKERNRAFFDKLGLPQN